MLHRALATLLCLLGAAAIGLGIASATLWRASDTLLATAQAAPGTTLLVTDPGVLDLAADEVTVQASAGADQTVVLAVGRTGDVEAWVGSDPVTRVTGLSDLVTLSTAEGLAEPAPAPSDAEETPAAEETAPAEEAPAEEAPAEEAPAEEAAAAPDPTGSDLWVLETSGTGEATLEWPDQDGRWSLLVATTGEDAGPPTVSLAWPQEVTTPWLVPGVAVGSALLLTGVLWWVLLLVRSRRSRGSVPAGAGVPSEPVAAPVGVTPTGAVPTGATPTFTPSTGPAAPAGVSSTTTEHGASVTAPASAGVGGAAAAAPLTRRQLREAEQQREREKREKETVRGRFPMRVAGPARDEAGTPAPTATTPSGAQEPSSRPGASASGGPTSAAVPRGAIAPAVPGPAAPAPAVPGPPAAGPAAPAPGASAEAASAPAASARVTPAPGPVPTGTAPVAAPPNAEGGSRTAPEAADEKPWARRLSGRLAGRGRSAPASAPPAPTPDPEPAATAPSGPSPAVPSASADAWRKAWGFPSGAAGADGASAWSPGAGADTSETEEGTQR